MSAIKSVILGLIVALAAGTPGIAWAEEGDDARVCITVIACGVGPNGDFRTFSTPCAMRDAGYAEVGYEHCGLGSSLKCGLTVKKYVCATGLDGIRRTYNNHCVAKSAQARRIRQGKCRKDRN